jgi:dethiobiotin synthetase
MARSIVWPIRFEAGFWDDRTLGALFVTATGTDIGKSFVTAGIIRALRRSGRAVAGLKPVMSGFVEERAAESDAGLLLTAMAQKIDAEAIARISPWRFAAPLSPDMAAAREAKTIDVPALIDFSRRALMAAEDAVLIEGVGGVMVPLDGHHTVLDWIIAVEAPVLLVAGSYLGTISHTLTALDVLRRQNVRVAAIVISETIGSTVALDDTARTIARFAQPIEVVPLPRLLSDPPDHAAFERLAALV